MKKRQSLKWLCLLALLMLQPTGSKAQSESYELVIEKRDDTTITEPISEGYPILNRALEPDGFYLTMKKKGKPNFSKVVAYRDIKRLYMRSTTGITPLTQSEIEQMDVYSIDGKLIFKKASTLKALPKGVYIIKNGHSSFKYVSK